MQRCQSCSSELPPNARFCAVCGVPAAAGLETATLTAIGSKRSESPSDLTDTFEEEGRFLPGTILGERYRITGLLGRGGMGEVYRATDLKLGQQVALKFLAEKALDSPSAVARFRGEVRLARQVSHPNVCRTYDIGEVDGHQYLSMEYVDGEDLASLLRRIGRLPEDKAIEIARDLCAGLAAAHDKGVLHRDLKPANILINRQGSAVITDFGLASFAGQTTDLGAGTPAYMAPELFEGKQASIATDIYSLGLVLYELFTGKRAIEANSLQALRSLHMTTPTSPSVLVKDLSASVERVILSCLDPVPGGRPASAQAVAAALPGGDPLTAALAAGTTPSPGVVAAAGASIGVSVRAAVGLLTIVVIFGAAAYAIGSSASLLNTAALDRSPDVLEDRAVRLLRAFGTEKGSDSADGFAYAGRYLSWAASMNKREKFSPITYWYRQTPRMLLNTQPLGRGVTVGAISEEDPPSQQSGMADVRLDSQGRLVSLQIVPPEADSAANTQTLDWDRVLRVAGVNAAKYKRTQPILIPRVMTDEQVAWVGVDTDIISSEIRIEAAALRGRLVWFQTLYPWSTTTGDQAPGDRNDRRLFRVITAILASGVVAVTLYLARRNLSGGRGDISGANRLAGFVFLAHFVAFLFGAHHQLANEELGLVAVATAFGLLKAALLWVGYIALEPLARRRWPHVLISWTRLLDGRWRDPLVGRDVLIGIAGATVCAALGQSLEMLRRSVSTEVSLYPSVYQLLNVRFYVASVINGLPAVCWSTLTLLLLLFLLRLVVKRDWIAVVCLAAVFAIVSTASSSIPALDGAANLLFYLFMLGTAAKFGLTSALFLNGCVELLVRAPVTADLSLWYSTQALISYLAVLVLAVVAFQAAMAGRALLPAHD